jgi:putative ABC transport system permease protein
MPLGTSHTRAKARTWRLALRLLRRDWRGGELRVLVAALIIAVAAITSVGFLTDRMGQALRVQANELLAADLRVASRDPIPEKLSEAARARGLATARTLSFRSMLSVGERLQLVEVKAVAAGYPLRGALRISATPFGAEHATHTIPAPGTVWLDPQLMRMLDLSVGDSVALGLASFRIAHVLAYEPDRGGDLFSIAPRLLMNLGNLAATGLVQPASRVTYRLLVAGDLPRVAAFRRWLEAHAGPTLRIEDVRDARPEMRSALTRAQRFLGLAALASVLLAGIAAALCARRHAARHLDAAALMRCLGARQGTVVAIHTVQLGALGVAASLGGCLVGYAAHTGLASLVRDLAFSELPPPSWRPLALGLGAGLATSVGFALAPILGLGRVPPARVLRRDLALRPSSGWVVYGLAVAALAALAVYQTRDLRLALYVLAAGVATFAALSGAALLLVFGLGRLRARVGVTWRFGLANIARRTRDSVVQMVAFGLGVMGLLLLTLVRGDLLAQWQRTLPADTPNYFLVNVQPAEVSAVTDLLRAHGLEQTPFYPMVRGRLLSIDGYTVSPDHYRSRRAKHLAVHDFNMSWMARLPPGNRVAAGSWWGGGGTPAPQFSVEEGLARTLGIKLGDRLSFEIAGSRVDGPVTSLRYVPWDSFRPNFFVLAAPGMLNAYPAQYITSFFLPRQHSGLLSEVVRSFPSVTVLDVDALLSRVRQLMDRAALGVEYVFLFSLLAGLTVLYAATQATLDERRLETAIVRALGGERRRILRGLAAEFVTLGLAAGTVGALAAGVTAAVLARQVFEFTYRPDPWMVLIGGGGAALGVALAGILGTRKVLRTPPVRALREL